MDGLAVLLVASTQAGPFVQQQVHHLDGEKQWRGTAAVPPQEQRSLRHLRSPDPGRGDTRGTPCAQTRLAYLEVAAVHGVVQRRAARAVRDVDSAQQRDDGLHALGGPVGSSDVQRRLPILVAGIDICRVLQEEVKCLLAGAEESRALTQPAGACRSPPARSGKLQQGPAHAFSTRRGCLDPHQPTAPRARAALAG